MGDIAENTEEDGVIGKKDRSMRREIFSPSPPCILARLLCKLKTNVHVIISVTGILT